MKKCLLLLVPLALFAQVEIDTVIRLPFYPDPSPGSFLTTAAFLPELNKLYVGSFPGHYFVVDCSTYQVVESLVVDVWGGPYYSWNGRRQKLYVTCNPRPDSTLVVDAAADSIISWLHVNEEMHQQAYLSDVDCLYKPAVDSVFAFDGATDSVVRRRTLGGLNTNVTWDSVEHLLYVGQGSHKQIYVYDYLADSVRNVIGVGAVSAVQPDALLFNSTCHKAYVGPFQSEPWESNVGIIDTERAMLVGVLPVRIWGGLDAQVAVDERDDKVYLADNDTYTNTPDTLWVVDCATDSVLKKVEYAHRGSGAMPVRWVPWSNRLYLAVTYPDGIHTSSLTILDCHTDSVIASGVLANYGGIQDIQLDPIRQRIFVVGVDTNSIYVLRDTGYGGVAEAPNADARTANPMPTMVRGVLFLAEVASRKPQAASLLDISGREVMELKPGANDVSRLGPGVYFVRSGPSAVSREPSAVTKVVVTR